MCILLKVIIEQMILYNLVATMLFFCNIIHRCANRTVYGSFSPLHHGYMTVHIFNWTLLVCCKA